MKPISLLVVDDSAVIRRLYRELLADTPDIQIVDTAKDAADAREKIKLLNPDVLTLDVEMPGMDGLSFLEKIMTLRPMPVIMASTLTQKGAAATIRALTLGAIDYIGKPDANQPLGTFKQELIDKIRAAASANSSIRNRAKPAVKDPQVIPFSSSDPARHIIAIGSSTGGVEALRDIFLTLPANSPPIVMTQHMPETFTPSFAQRLDQLSQVTVAEARHGDVLKPGHAFLAPGNRHLKVRKMGGQFICQIEDSPHVSGHRPSVDVLFRSVAEEVGNRAIGIILTGMGKDGADGMLKMREKGAYTVGQSEQSCVVYGMPKAAFTAGAVVKEMPLHEIPAHVLRHCEKH